ncbi:hypothetical protein SAMN05444169_6285 [Bradyrhizobium erythrophlei]|uniref:Uncharacterized protein n=1 Tax=Bradyrhizobium erythrophlei TaxID=1437360 RepID=A0A1M5R116_9BRAD|nr:hypothetical protein SAMN05444169_6285 [Bradyrhizobium erythrophlei]
MRPPGRIFYRATYLNAVMKCTLCEDCGWVCESHHDRPWEGKDACTCGGAGMPCPWCNLPEKDEEPRLPDGFKTEFDKKGWRH